LRPYLAKVYQCDSSGVAFGDILVYRPTQSTDSTFAFYSMISEAFIDIVDGSTYGSKMPRASVEFVSDMPIATPSKQEQVEIGKYLSTTTSKIDNLITKATKAIDLFKERRTALISAVVTGKVDVRGVA
jgi:restriction endonuclease S subunit